jgi:Holliday junction resolvasome RuvABC DNA-binding subunit
MFQDSNLVKTNLHLITKSVSTLVDAITVKETTFDTLKQVESNATYTKLIVKSSNDVLFCFDESLVHPINSELILVEKLGLTQAFQLALLDEENIDFLELINLDTNYLFEEYELVISVRLAQKNLVLIELSTRFITLNLENYQLKEVLNLNSFDI